MKRTTKKLTLEQVLQDFHTVHGDRYDYSLVEYKNRSTPVKIVCKEHGVFLQTPGSHKNGRGCPLCARNDAKATELTFGKDSFEPGTFRKTKERVLQEFKLAHGDRYDYSQVEYVNSQVKVKIGCAIHGLFKQSPITHLNGQGCPKCRYDTNARKTFNRMQATILDRFRAAHGDLYDYSQVVYKDMRTKVDIVCKKHGVFSQRAYAHLNGQGCPKCKAEKTRSLRSYTEEDFVEKANRTHHGTYSYYKGTFLGSHKKLPIFCKIHGDFWQTSEAHIAGQGCKKCGYARNGVQKRNTAEPLIIAKIKEVHGDTYTYERFKYHGTKKEATITCRIHGDFKQVVEYHIGGSGCPKCANSLSHPEEDLLNFITSLGVKATPRDRTLIAPLELDILIQEKNIAIEFNGTYWHSDKVKDKNYHKNKSEACARKGIRLIHINQTDWGTRREQIENMLRHTLGVYQGEKINARECEVVDVDIGTTSAFLNKNHIQGESRNAPVRLGLQYKGTLVALMVFTKGGTLRGTARLVNQVPPWELSRYATSASVRGGASKLLKHFRSLYPNEEIVSFSQNDWYSGEGMYHKLGFEKDSESRPDYRVWHPKIGIAPKSHWQRRNIPKRLLEIGAETTFDPDTDPRTEWQIEDEVGALRIWDSGKTRWVLQA